MKRHLFIAATIGLVAGCQSTPLQSEYFPVAEFPHNDELDNQYLLAPGDQLEVIVHSAPELTREVTVGPDGRFRMPYTGPILASGRTIEEVRFGARQALASELKEPDVDVLLLETPSQQIFVGGEVAEPGMVELPGAIDPLQAIIMAGGVTNEGKIRQVVLMRRMPGGEVKSAVFDLKAGIYDPRLADWAPLRRFDIVYVTRKRIADENLFINQFILSALPINISYFYDLGEDSR